MARGNYSTSLIVLRTTKVSDTSLVLHCLCSDSVRRSFIVKGLGKSRATAFFAPLSMLNAEIVGSSHSSLSLAHAFSFEYPLRSIRSSMAKGAICMFLSEMVYRLAAESGGEGLYEWLRGRVLLLEALESNFANFHLSCVLEFIRISGFRLVSAQGFAEILPSEDIPALEALLGAGSLAEELSVDMNGAQRSRICSALCDYLASNLGVKTQINSLSVLSEIF